METRSNRRCARCFRVSGQIIPISGHKCPLLQSSFESDSQKTTMPTIVYIKHEKENQNGTCRTRRASSGSVKVSKQTPLTPKKKPNNSFSSITKQISLTPKNKLNNSFSSNSKENSAMRNHLKRSYSKLLIDMGPTGKVEIIGSKSPLPTKRALKETVKLAPKHTIVKPLFGKRVLRCKAGNLVKKADSKTPFVAPVLYETIKMKPEPSYKIPHKSFVEPQQRSLFGPQHSSENKPDVAESGSSHSSHASVIPNSGLVSESLKKADRDAMYKLFPHHPTHFLDFIFELFDEQLNAAMLGIMHLSKTNSTIPYTYSLVNNHLLHCLSPSKSCNCWFKELDNDKKLTSVTSSNCSLMKKKEPTGLDKSFDDATFYLKSKCDINTTGGLLRLSLEALWG